MFKLCEKRKNLIEEMAIKLQEKSDAYRKEMKDIKDKKENEITDFTNQIASLEVSKNALIF